MKLTFGIPTRNRADLLASVLDRIIAQATEEIDIVVVDGASTDHTQEIVRRRRERFPRIQYFRRERCVGVDRDISKAVELAEGDYCWLLSDDDYLEDGSVSHVLDVLRMHQGIAGMTTNYVDYDSELRFPVSTNRSSSAGTLKSDHLFNSADECFSVLGLQLSFISTQIVETALWRQVASSDDLEPYINDWLMVYITGRMMQIKPRWFYDHTICIRRRIDNDSFNKRVGVYNRQLIAHVAYRFTVAGLFGNRSAVYEKVFFSLLSDRMPRSLAVIKANGAPLGLQWKLFVLYTKYYGRHVLYWIRVVPLFCVPNFVFKLVRRTYFRAMAKTQDR